MTVSHIFISHRISRIRLCNWCTGQQEAAADSVIGTPHMISDTLLHNQKIISSLFLLICINNC